ncbi:exocyst complex component EXO70H1-like [Cryptomeria japonica]|uniref:exocyst complex component EXO70H1-like n=1 Tax=Cryptomeria japonica TaxID=3369 RepID=UPI0027D9E30F|nr:exocyst complex component EXO70H1-like [Cryptomeria japonica]
MTRGALRMHPTFRNPVITNTLDSNNLEDMEEMLAAAEILISKWDTNKSSKMLFQSNAEEVRMYMDSVQNLQRLMEHLSAGGTNAAQLVRAQRLMKMSMARLQNEFHKILLSNGEPIDPDRESSARPSSSSSTEDSITCSDGDDDGSSQFSSICSSSDRTYEFDTVPLDAMADLRNIAQRMAKSGYTRECVRVFTLTRKSVVEESLYNLGVEKVRLNDVRKMEWTVLDDKIKKWIYAAKISIRILFAREKRLCVDVFGGIDKMRDSCFAEISKEPAERLLAFAEAVAAERNLVQLGEAARGILMEFEKAVEKEKSKVPIAGGSIHPLTRYVMNYLTFLSDYKESLVNIITDAPRELPKVLPDNELTDSSAPLSVHLGWTVFTLLCKINKKSDLYKDVALSYLFLMNNLHYIVQKVNGSEIKYILGDGWVRKQWNKVRQYAVKYERAAWMKVLSCVTDEEVPSNGGVLKERLKEFNSAMEEVKRRHGEWVVPDVNLREKLRVSITEKLIPSYDSFLSRIRSRFESDMCKILCWTCLRAGPYQLTDLFIHIRFRFL